MANEKSCPKCGGTMQQGRILKLNEYVTHNQYMYVFAADTDSSPGPAKALAGKPASTGRKPLVAYCCENCGFTELYGLNAG